MEEEPNPLVGMVIRPPRAEYDVADLGAKHFKVGDEECARADYFI